MGRHETRTAKLPVTGRHAVPIPYTEPPAPKRPRVRNDRYTGALELASVLLGTISVGLLCFVALFAWVLITMGPEKLPGFFIVSFAIWCWRRKR